MKTLKEKAVFAHAMLIGEGRDTDESISNLQEFANESNLDFAIFTFLTPFPGTEAYEEAKRNGWIEDLNWSHYYIIHVIMPTVTSSMIKVQEELYEY